MVQTKYQQKKNMEITKETSTSSDLSQKNPKMNVSRSSNPPRKFPLSSQYPPEDGHVEDIIDNEMTQKEILEMARNLENHQIFNAMMRLYPSQYMLELAKEGAKIPFDYDVSIIVERTPGIIPSILSMLPLQSVT